MGNTINRSAFDALSPAERMAHVRNNGRVVDDPPDAANLAAEIDRYRRQQHEVREARIRESLGRRGLDDSNPTKTAADKALDAFSRGDLDGARGAATTRVERWPVFRMAPKIAQTLWPDTAAEFADTVRIMGDPSKW